MEIPKLLTLSEVATATHAPRSTVQGWAYAGKLPAVKLGRRRLVREADLAAFIEGGTGAKSPARTRRVARSRGQSPANSAA